MDQTERRFRIAATTEQVLLGASVFWALAVNHGFFRAALKGSASAWTFGLALGLALVALHFLLLAPLATRWTVKPLVAVTTVLAAVASYYMDAYGVYLDPGMVRNVLHSDVAEARELLSWSLAGHLALNAGLPLALLWQVRITPRTWPRAALVRTAAMAAAACVLSGAVFAVFQPFASLMRNHKEARYLVTPANLVWSAVMASGQQAKAAMVPLRPLGLDAAAGPSWTAQAKPRIVVLVVGETARAANWGLNGYARQTTPRLARLPVINFGAVDACGTSTEVSLPCMFAPVGRRDYDESRIRGSESLLHVLARAGVQVRWRDNQSGCKGVCDGLPNENAASLQPPESCAQGRCLDESLLHGLDGILARAQGTQLLVLHQLGNHGPSYFRRYPPAFAKFQPACGEDDLSRCTQDEIVNAYDNALLYTDHVLARAIETLQAHAAEVDSALVYVSDHGESLGENGLFLHGMPHAIAPKVQKQVPMVMWMSAGFAGRAGIDVGCLRSRAAAPVSHDHLFHTLLRLADVRTTLYEPAWDIAAACRDDAAEHMARH